MAKISEINAFVDLAARWENRHFAQTSDVRGHHPSTSLAELHPNKSLKPRKGYMCADPTGSAFVRNSASGFDLLLLPEHYQKRERSRSTSRINLGNVSAAVAHVLSGTVLPDAN